MLDPEASRGAVQAALEELREHYDLDGHGVELVEIGGGWQILTRAEYTETIERAQLAAEDRERRFLAGEFAGIDLGFDCTCLELCDELDDRSGRPVHAPECACDCDVA